MSGYKFLPAEQIDDTIPINVNVVTSTLTPKFAFASVAASQTNSQIVALVSGKQIRVLAAKVITGPNGPTPVTFRSKPAGTGTNLTPADSCAASGGYVLDFNPVGWFQTVASEALTVTTGAGDTTGIQVVYVEV